MISLSSEGLKIGEERKKRPRTAFTASQIKALEQEFEKNKYLSVSKRLQLSKQLKLTETQVSTNPIRGGMKGQQQLESCDDNQVLSHRKLKGAQSEVERQETSIVHQGTDKGRL